MNILPAGGISFKVIIFAADITPLYNIKENLSLNNLINE